MPSARCAALCSAVSHVVDAFQHRFHFFRTDVIVDLLEIFETVDLGLKLQLHGGRRSLDNQPVQIVRLDRFTKGLPQPVQEIEDEGFFDLDLFLRALESMNFASLAKGGESPTQNREGQGREEKAWPHDDRGQVTSLPGYREGPA